MTSRLIQSLRSPNLKEPDVASRVNFAALAERAKTGPARTWVEDTLAFGAALVVEHDKSGWTTWGDWLKRHPIPCLKNVSLSTQRSDIYSLYDICKNGDEPHDGDNNVGLSAREVLECVTPKRSWRMLRQRVFNICYMQDGATYRARSQSR